MMELINRFYFWRSLLHSLSNTLIDKNGFFAAVNRSDKSVLIYMITFMSPLRYAPDQVCL